MHKYKVNIGAVVFVSENIWALNAEDAQKSMEKIVTPDWVRKAIDWQEPFVSCITTVYADTEPDSTPPPAREMLKCPHCGSTNVEMTDHDALEIGGDGQQFDSELYGTFFCSDCNEDFRKTLRVCI